ncbi:hypothetical protein OHS81_16795 [Streptomyces sp. NBC_00400]|uniref:hypothetical protein n=1 Tax=Streptomyces sp. NBC_00400 TaxID=2975737 RepID=UPI002E237FC2
MTWGISLHFRRNAIAAATAATLGLGGMASTAHADSEDVDDGRGALLALQDTVKR